MDYRHPPLARRPTYNSGLTVNLAIPTPPLSKSPLSPSPATAISQSAFNNALNAYRSQTGKDLTSHPLVPKLQSCCSPAAILALLYEQFPQVDQSRSVIDGGLTRCLSPTVNVLYTSSAALGDGFSLLISPASAIFVAIGILLSPAKDINPGQEPPVGLFERIGSAFKPLEAYIEVPLTLPMTDKVTKIMVEVLSVLTTATKEIKQGSTMKYFRRLGGKADSEDALKKLNKLIQEEAQLAAEQVRAEFYRAGDTMNGARKTKGIDDQNRKQVQESLEKWLSPPDPSINHNIAYSTRHSGSTAWFLQGKIIKDWKSTGSLLYIHGKPGSGKTILCSTIIQALVPWREVGLASVAYFYFDFRDRHKQSRENLLSSLLIQFSDQCKPCYDILSRLYSAHGNGSRNPGDDSLTRCLKEMLFVPDQGPIYIILDALDECPTSGLPSPRENVLELLRELVELRLPNLRLCVTSRPEFDLQTALEHLTSHSISLHDESGQKGDIVNYIGSVIKSDQKMQKLREEDKGMVIESLARNADGVFGWASYKLEELRRSQLPITRRVLDESPKDLDELYEHILTGIKDGDQELARRLLQCLVVTIRPLRVDELAEVLAIDLNDDIPKLNPNWRRPDPELAVLSICPSLVAIVDVDGFRVVQFSHFSIKEFLMSDRLAARDSDVSRYRILLEPAHAMLAQACLGVLLQVDDPFRKHGNRGSPLARYAAEHWIDHAEFENVSSLVQSGAERLLDPGQPYYAKWTEIYDPIGPSLPGTHPGRPAVLPIYCAALFGCRRLAEQLVRTHPRDVNVRGGRYVTSLLAALYKEHPDVAGLLLEHGADVDVRDNSGWTPLHVASLKGYPDIVQTLITHGAEVNARENTGSTPLHVASQSGYADVVHALLNYGADVNAEDGDRRTPLHLASNNKKLDVAQLLVEYGANVYARDLNKQTPFQNSMAVSTRKSTRR